ncbi:hypothetical protein [Rhizobium sp. RU36D]|uniref:hypothetical protein n=1 Tax=Rhizobium sp. RU36D TaxID=1907415 RepID=UPI0009D8DA62|nr:hypothetical protein [Rhizobium sp. RU36D]SMD16342.1 hypothetical protein SAMN05880593_12951 [Rhizobium sp. RU36D]
MNPSTRSIAAARRAEAVIAQYQNALARMSDLVDDIGCFPVGSKEFEDLFKIGQNLSAYAYEATAIEEAILDIAFDITEATKAAA